MTFVFEYKCKLYPSFIAQNLLFDRRKLLFLRFFGKKVVAVHLICYFCLTQVKILTLTRSTKYSNLKIIRKKLSHGLVVYRNWKLFHSLKTKQ